ncbi:hypothetical protein V6N11_054386 [Hibiscus sabdariffa]|uniref:Uncharacterized protein n=1 Tax=Hibiscus sabdariffa TaxID=183260 RepID=A0ABR2S4L0_9ROSI
MLKICREQDKGYNGSTQIILGQNEKIGHFVKQDSCNSKVHIGEPETRESLSTFLGEVKVHIGELVACESQSTFLGGVKVHIREPVARESQSTFLSGVKSEEFWLVARESRSTFPGKSEEFQLAARESRSTFPGGAKSFDLKLVNPYQYFMVEQRVSTCSSRILTNSFNISYGANGFDL